MAEPLSSLYTISAAPSLSAFEKLAPPPPEVLGSVGRGRQEKVA